MKISDYAIVAVAFIAILAICLVFFDVKREYSSYTPTNMHYQLIEGKLVNITIDSLQVEYLKMEIEKSKRNVIYEYTVPKRNKR